MAKLKDTLACILTTVEQSVTMVTRTISSDSLQDRVVVKVDIPHTSNEVVLAAQSCEKHDRLMDVNFLSSTHLVRII